MLHTQLFSQLHGPYDGDISAYFDATRAWLVGGADEFAHLKGRLVHFVLEPGRGDASAAGQWSHSTRRALISSIVDDLCFALEKSQMIMLCGTLALTAGIKVASELSETR